MKKQQYVYILMSIALFCFLPNVAKAEGIPDQKCASQPTGKVSLAGDGYVIYQSFKPQYNLLTGISVLLHTDGIGKIKLSVLTKDRKPLVSKTLAEQSSSGEKEYKFEFTPFKVIVGQEYLFIAEPTSMDNQIVDWYYVQDDEGKCYPEGIVTVGLKDPKVDMRFITYGYNEKDIVAGQAEKTTSGVTDDTAPALPVESKTADTKKSTDTSLEKKIDPENTIAKIISPPAPVNKKEQPIQRVKSSTDVKKHNNAYLLFALIPAVLLLYIARKKFSPKH